MSDADVAPTDGGTDAGSMDAGPVDDAGHDAGASTDAETHDAPPVDASPLTDVGVDAASDGGLTAVDGAAADSGVTWVDCGGGAPCSMLPTAQACADIFPMAFLSQTYCDGSVEYRALTSRSLSSAVDSFASSSSTPGEPELWYAFDLPSCPPAGGGSCSESFQVFVGTSYDHPAPPVPPHVTIFDRCTGLEVHDARSAMAFVTLPSGRYVAMVEVTSTSGSVIFDVMPTRREYEPWPGC